MAGVFDWGIGGLGDWGIWGRDNYVIFCMWYFIFDKEKLYKTFLITYHIQHIT